MPTILGNQTVDLIVPPPSQCRIADVIDGMEETIFLCSPVDIEANRDKGHRNRVVLQNNRRRTNYNLLTWGGYYPKNVDNSTTLQTVDIAVEADYLHKKNYQLYRIREKHFSSCEGNALITPNKILFENCRFQNRTCPNGLINKVVDVAIFCGHGVANADTGLYGKVFIFGLNPSPDLIEADEYAACTDQATVDFFSSDQRTHPMPGVNLSGISVTINNNSTPIWSAAARTRGDVQLVFWNGCNTTSSFTGQGLPAVTCANLGAAFSVGFMNEWTGDQSKAFFKTFSYEKMHVSDGPKATVYQAVHHSVDAAGWKYTTTWGWRSYCGLAANATNNVASYRLPDP